MKVVLIFGWFIIACSSHNIKPDSVKEISKAQSKKCTFIDDLHFEKEAYSENKFISEIRIYAAMKGSNAFVVDERVNNGNKTKVLGSLFNCSK